MESSGASRQQKIPKPIYKLVNSVKLFIEVLFILSDLFLSRLVDEKDEKSDPKSCFLSLLTRNLITYNLSGAFLLCAPDVSKLKLCYQMVNKKLFLHSIEAEWEFVADRIKKKKKS